MVRTLIRVVIGLPLCAMLLAVGIAWINAETGETEGQMRSYLMQYSVFQRDQLARTGSHASAIGDGLPIPIGLEILVLHASPEAHGAVVRHRMAIPRLYCALWTGPQPRPGPPVPDLRTPTFDIRCDRPEVFEPWIAATRAGR